jgi:hypothetical protein
MEMYDSDTYPPIPHSSQYLPHPPIIPHLTKKIKQVVLNHLEQFIKVTRSSKERRDTQHNDAQHNATQHKGFTCDTQHE